MKRSFFRGALAAVFLVAGVSPAFAGSLRVLLVGDTNDRSIGKSVVTDLANFEGFAQQISARTGLKLDLKVIKGAGLKSRPIMDAVKNLKVDSDDAVIFYYSGHGFRTQPVKTRWPLLYIPDAGTKGVDFQWVIDTIDAKKPRMVIAISDSCNNYIDLPQAGINSRAMLEDQDEAWRKLFVEFSGRIYASGSIVGQFSFGQDATGGAFTSRFLSIVRAEVKSTTANWDNIMKLATRQIVINSPQQKTQDPQYELVKGEAVQTPQASVEQTHEIHTAEPEPPEEHNEQCKALSEFASALATVKSSMPAKFDFRRQRQELSGYQQMVTALVQAGGDKQMVQLSRTMQMGLRQKNWPRFRSAVWAYEGHIASLHSSACASQ
jgi:hypothetical protein